MLLNGCFGSSLAHAPTSDVCKACPAIVACGAKVNQRYPMMIKLLSKFSDSRGVLMAEQWLSATDKRTVLAARKAAATRNADRATFGDAATGPALRASIDKRALPILEKCVAKRINPLTAPVATLKTAHPAILSALTALQASPLHRDDLARVVASQSALSATSAKRMTSATISFLTRCGRIAANNDILEIR